ncbi:hypothetical protein AB4Z32_12450 [Massilia sp. 2TAF26]|uniref:hypothetical protein n=1 Tax=Massilia sp. 2TAF26 TaxID=3233012 RepID=UPI003F9C8111
MQARQFEQFLQRLSSLTRRQRDRLLDLLHSATGLDRVLKIVEQPGMKARRQGDKARDLE